MRLRRALLFMPGDSRRKIEKAVSLNADCIIMDLEDGVAHSQKQVARETIAAALRELAFGHSERLIRINAVNAENTYAADLHATLPALPDGYVLPKVEHAAQLREVDLLLSAQEAKHNLSPGHFALLAIIETALGVVNLREIAACGLPRLQALIFGAEDFAGDMGAVRTASGHEIAYARAAVVLHAKAYGLSAIDTVYLTLDDAVGLAADARAARELGYTGKMAIHPKQIAPIHAAFTPSTEEIAAAARLIDAFTAHQADGRGAFQLDGKMVDMPIIRAAQRVMAAARAAETAYTGGDKS